MGAGAAIQLLPRLRSRWAEIRASRLRRRSEAEAAVVWERVKSSCAWRFASSMSVGFELAEAGPWSSRLGSGVSSLLALSSWLSSAADFLPPKTTITPLAMSPPARAARTRAPDHLRFPAFRLHLHDLVPLEGETDLLPRGVGLPPVPRPWDRHGITPCAVPSAGSAPAACSSDGSGRADPCRASPVPTAVGDHRSPCGSGRPDLARASAPRARAGPLLAAERPRLLLRALLREPRRHALRLLLGRHVGLAWSAPVTADEIPRLLPLELPESRHWCCVAHRLLLAGAETPLHPTLHVGSVTLFDAPPGAVPLPHQPLHVAALLRGHVVGVEIAVLVHPEARVIPHVVVHALLATREVVLQPLLALLVPRAHAPVDLLPGFVVPEAVPGFPVPLLRCRAILLRPLVRTIQVGTLALQPGRRSTLPELCVPLRLLLLERAVRGRVRLPEPGRRRLHRIPFPVDVRREPAARRRLRGHGRALGLVLEHTHVLGNAPAHARCLPPHILPRRLRGSRRCSSPLLRLLLQLGGTRPHVVDRHSPPRAGDPPHVLGEHRPLLRERTGPRALREHLARVAPDTLSGGLRLLGEGALGPLALHLLPRMLDPLPGHGPISARGQRAGEVLAERVPAEQVPALEEPAGPVPAVRRLRPGPVLAVPAAGRIRPAAWAERPACS